MLPAPLAKKKDCFFSCAAASSLNSCCHWECNHVGLLCWWREAHSLGLSNAVLAAQVAVSFHCQCAAVSVSKPPGDGWNIHAGFDAARCKQVPQIVMCDAICADFLTSSIKGLLTFADTEYFCVQRLAGSFTSHAFKQSASLGNEGHAAQFPILRAGCCVAAHNDFASLEIRIAPC